jgi:arylsulfatase A-like enzyme
VRRWWAWPVAIGVGLVARAWLNTPPTPRHVVIISLDTTRADALGPWRGPDAHTPAIDALAADAVTFDWHYSAAPTTLASHTTLMTGRWPQSHGVPRNDYAVHEDNVFLAELLRDEGWRTAAFLGAIPLAVHSGFPQGFDHVDENFTLHRTADDVAQTERRGAEVTAAALAWLDTNPVADGDQLFLFVHYFDAHAPYTSGPEALAAHGLSEPDNAYGTLEAVMRLRRMLRGRDPKALALAGTMERLYRAGVTEADAAVGALFAGLRERGVYDDALIIVTADHGETFATHDEVFDHGETVFDETVHTPLIVRFPGGWSGGERITERVANLDVFPTVLELLGLADPPAEGPAAIDGLSLLPLVRDDLLRGSRPPAFVEATKPHVKDKERWQNAGMRKAIVTDEGKLHLDPRKATVALYDLSADPGELTDLAPAQPDLTAALRAQLVAWTQSAHPLPSGRISSARVKAELAALGYLEANEPAEGEAPDEADDDGAPAADDAAPNPASSGAPQ